MALILRVDVDKPFGNSSLYKRLMSKFSENIFTYYCTGHCFLKHLRAFLEFCNENNISGYIYFRICTRPSLIVKGLMKAGGHKAGLHLENSRSYDSFIFEFEKLKKISEMNFGTFTKHGSGKLKLGKHHYPEYEPEKYSDWALRSGVSFPFGNMIATSPDDLDCKNGFYSHMFWIEKEYRHKGFERIEDLVEHSKTKDVPVIIHPCNFISSAETRAEFEKLVELAKKEKVEWITPF